MKELIQELRLQGILKSSSIVKSFQHIDRADFVPDDLKDQAYLNIALPIGQGQTISQPLTVAFMLELLAPQPGDKILDIGSGSGWQTALLAFLVSQTGKGRVIGIERIPELYQQSIKTISAYNYIKSGVVKMINASALRGLSEEAPFDKIIAAASLLEKPRPLRKQVAAAAIPKAWKEQLKKDGRIVVPIGNSIFLIKKKEDGSFEEEEYPGFAFVPFVEQ